MPIIDKSQARGARILKHKDIVSDSATIDVNTSSDEKVLLSTTIKTIDAVADIKELGINKVDYWDDLPDLSDADTAIEFYEQNRTVVYTGHSNGKYRRGKYYRCKPDASYSWIDIYPQASTDILRCPETVIPTSTLTEDTIVINDSRGQAIGFIYYDVNESEEKIIRIAIGDSIEQAVANGKTFTAYKYSSSGAIWSRYTDIDEFISYFKGGSVNAATSFDSLAQFFKVHKTTVELNANAFDWKPVAHLTDIPLFPYDTIKPQNNTCYFNETSSCFYFGILPASEDEVTFYLELSNLAQNQFYGNNVILFDTTKEVKVNFIPKVANSEFTASVCGDSVSGKGKYRALVEVVPDGSVVVMIKKLDGSSSSGGDTSEDIYAYGFRYNLGSRSPAVQRIVLNRYVDENGKQAEEIKTVSSFTSMPCHEFRRCLYKDGKVNYYLYKTNSAYQEDGKTPADLTGADGDVAVEMPLTYLRVTVPAKPTTTPEDNDGEQYNGYIDYLVSLSPIPDPPTDSDGNFTTCYRMVYNGPHPVFRVGGELDLDDEGKFQYETKYNYTTKQFEPTGVPLRKARDAAYGAAFATVACWHAANARNTTIKATASTYNDLVTPDSSAYLIDGASYPQQVAGTCVGGLASFGEGRSLAPYREGEMTGIKFPGVYVNISTTSIKAPATMPGGCAEVFACNDESSTPGDYSPKTTYTYTTTKIFAKDDGSTYSKDYKLFYSATGWNTYPAGWFLSDGETVIANADWDETTQGTFTDFSALTWTIRDEVSDATVSMSTINDSYKLTIGPRNYGNRNEAFNWNDQNSWDTKMCYNPNWALNYRPLVSQARSSFQTYHQRGYTTTDNKSFTLYDASEYNQFTMVRSEGVDHGFNLANGKDSCTFRRLYRNDYSTKYIAQDAEGNDYPAQQKEYLRRPNTTYWNYESYPFDDNSSDYKNGTGLCQFSSTSDVSFNLGTAYWYKCTHTSYVGDESYISVAIKYRVGDLIPNDTFYSYDEVAGTYSKIYSKPDSGYAYQYFEADKIYYAACSYVAEGYRQEPISGGVIKTGFWYNREIQALSNYGYQDPNNRYLDLVNAGYKPLNSTNPSTGSYDITADEGLDLDMWTCSDKGTITTTRTWTRSDADKVPYKLAFDHARLTWNIYRMDSDWTPLYESMMADPTQFTLRNCSSNNGYAYRRVLTRGAGPGNNTFGSATLGFLDTFASGTTTLAFTAVPPATTAVTGTYRDDREYYTLSGTTYTRVVADAGTTISDTVYMFNMIVETSNTYVSGRTYYTRTGAGTAAAPYVFTKATVTSGELVSGTYYYIQDYRFRKWVYNNGDTHLRVEFIEEDDTRSVTDSGNAINYDFGGHWVVASYASTDYTTVAKVVTSDMDFILLGNANGNHMGAYKLFYRVCNPYMRNSQRTYDASTGKTTNTSLVYEKVQDATGTTNKGLCFLVDENGNLPEYIKSRFASNSSVLNSLTNMANGHSRLEDFTEHVIPTTASDTVMSYVKETGNFKADWWNQYYYLEDGVYTPVRVDRVVPHNADGTTQKIYTKNSDDTYTERGWYGDIFNDYPHNCYIRSGEEGSYTYEHVDGVSGYYMRGGYYYRLVTTAIYSFYDYKANWYSIYRPQWTMCKQGTSLTDNAWRYSDYKIEYIKSTDTRVLEDGTPLNSKYTNRWIIIKYNYNNPSYVVSGAMWGSWMFVRFNADYATVFAYDSTQTDVRSYQTAITPCAWSTYSYSQKKDVGTAPRPITDFNPWDTYQAFTARPTGTDRDGATLFNNDIVLRFKKHKTVYVTGKSARAWNCQTRLKQYMALMMVIDGATFDTQSGISTGKSWLSTFNYNKSTFCGRTVPLGNVSGEIIWDPDVDINIRFADWSSTAQGSSKYRVVAFNWRGYENPFGNIGEYEDGIIPCTRHLRGHEVPGFHECLNPDAYSDSMSPTNTYKVYVSDYGNNTNVSAVYAEYTAGAEYSWIEHAFPGSGWIRRWDPITFLPTRNGGSSTTYCCDQQQIRDYYVGYRGIGYDRSMLDQNGIPVIRNGSWHSPVGDVYDVWSLTYNRLMYSRTRGTRLQF